MLTCFLSIEIIKCKFYLAESESVMRSPPPRQKKWQQVQFAMIHPSIAWFQARIGSIKLHFLLHYQTPQFNITFKIIVCTFVATVHNHKPFRLPKRINLKTLSTAKHVFLYSKVPILKPWASNLLHWIVFA